MVVGVQHDDNVRAAPQRFAIASLLVAAVTQILFVHKHRQAQFRGDSSGLAMAAVINQNNLIDEIFGDFTIGLFQT